MMSFKRMRRDIEEAEYPAKQTLIEDARSVVTRFIAWAEPHLQILRKSIINEPHWQHMRAEYDRLAKIFAGVDVGAQMLLALMYLPGLPLLLNLACSILLAFGIAYAVGSGARIYSSRTNFSSARSVRLCRDAAAVVLFLVAPSGILLLASKVASGSLIPFLATLFPYCLATVAEALPIAAGLFLACGQIIAQPEKLEAKLTEAKRFLEWLNAQSKPPDDTNVSGAGTSNAPEGPPSSTTPIRKSAAAGPMATMALALILLGPLSRLGYSQAGPAYAGPANHSFACSSLVDDTTSVNRNLLLRAVNLLLQPTTLANFLQAGHCTELTAADFGDAGEFTTFNFLRIPQQPAAMFSCANAHPRIDPARRILLYQVGFRNYYDRRARALCIRKLTVAKAIYKKRFAAFRKALRSILLPSKFPDADCTAIHGLINFVAATQGTHLIFSDGRESCGKMAQVHVIGKVVLVIVPGIGPIEKAGPAALRRARRWQQLVPGLVVLPFTAIGAPGWTDSFRLK